MMAVGAGWGLVSLGADKDIPDIREEEGQEPWVELASGRLNSESAQSSVGGPPAFQTWSRQVTGWGKACQAQGPAIPRPRRGNELGRFKGQQTKRRERGKGEALRGVHQSLVTGPT